MPNPPKKPDATKKPVPAEKKPVAKAATNPFLARHPPRSGRAGAGLSVGSKRGGR
ncbi:MAG: hypothetical protein IAE78_28700 [Myxococcus sp.]|nr:hypothetical protein [Myxococcus sp.]